jgi:dTDP-D-glucose 4,6-dehydratase
MPKQNVENSVFRPNVKKLEELLHFTAKTEINDGLKKTVNWYSKQKQVE